LHYAGGVGTGFSERELATLRNRLTNLKAAPPDELLIAGDPIDRAIQWVRPELVVEVQYTAWSGAGRVRHPVYLGLREDKTPREVVREVADPAARRSVFTARPGGTGAVRPSRGIGNVAVSHPDRQLWPGITKRDLAEYWEAVATHALPSLAHRPLSIVRCPDGIEGEHFFQKNGHGHLPLQIREGSVSGSPYLAIDDVNGLIALAQMSAIELHPWGAGEGDPTHPDWLVFDLDPGEGVAFSNVIQAAHEVRDRLIRIGLLSFCLTTGGKGLHVVVPLTPQADWDAETVLPRLCRVDEPGRSEALLGASENCRSPRSYSYRLAAQRHGRNSGVVILSPRAAGGRCRHPARMG
jgi:bifunctional non-homologous end joining protein LigD